MSKFKILSPFTSLISLIVLASLSFPAVSSAQLFEEEDVRSGPGKPKVTPAELIQALKSQWEPHGVEPVLENREGACLIFMAPYYPVAVKKEIPLSLPNLLTFPPGTPLPSTAGLNNPKVLFPNPTDVDAGTSDVEDDYKLVTSGDRQNVKVADVEWRTCDAGILRLAGNRAKNPNYDPSRPMMCAVKVQVKVERRKLYLYSGLATLKELEACSAEAKQPKVDARSWLQNTLHLDKLDSSRFKDTSYIAENTPVLIPQSIDKFQVEHEGTTVPGGRIHTEHQKKEKVKASSADTTSFSFWHVLSFLVLWLLGAALAAKAVTWAGVGRGIIIGTGVVSLLVVIGLSMIGIPPWLQAAVPFGILVAIIASGR